MEVTPTLLDLQSLDLSIDRLRARNERLENELAKTKAALEVVGKAHALLELLSEGADSEPPSTK